MGAASEERISARIAEAIKQADAPLIGHTLPEGINLIGLLGSGASADTYLGENEKSRPRYFAVKIFKPWILRTQGESERIEIEVMTMQRISHRNLMKVYGFGIDESLHVPLVYLLNEFLDGPMLPNFLKDNDRIEANVISDLMGQLCEGLAHLHANRIVHRDIKPENIIIISENGHHFLKILDFGVIKALDDKELTETDYFLGTIRYAAPEWIQGKGDSPSLDAYSVGAILYRVLHREDPFADIGNNRARIEYAILSGKRLFSTTSASVMELKDKDSEWAEFFRFMGVWLTQQDESARPTDISETAITFSEGIEGNWWKSKVADDFLVFVNSPDFHLRSPKELSFSGGTYRSEGSLIRHLVSRGVLNLECVEALRQRVFERLLNEIANFVSEGMFKRTDVGEIIEDLFSELRMDRALESPFAQAVAKPQTWDVLMHTWFADYGFFDYGDRRIYELLSNPIRMRLEEEFSNGGPLFAAVLPAISRACVDTESPPYDWDWYYSYVEAADCCLRASRLCLANWLEEFFIARAIAYYKASLGADGYGCESNWSHPEEETRDRVKRRMDRHEKYIREMIDKLERVLLSMVIANHHPLPIVEKDHWDGERLQEKTVVTDGSEQRRFVPKMKDNFIVGMEFNSA